ncbi:Auxin Efflux Carrier [Sulfurimonas denitrificans DSM 1251]|uniref:Auxin Efflux Carrier n=1 Tax=Sulfurimonas denitrificans (strain ATCC 33889 / DSM 1251) TaxID=326298 RepID=Q30RE4_SULDN|nr:AEC family transporter [Sulfurimonas denitrificans]ABB44437.1 Auxin Efflux Carrier [Sulfurimonas denitrificans DSM 1251]
MDNFALIFSAIFIGYIIGKKEIFAANTPLILNQFILYISAPALVLLKVPQLTLSLEVLIPVFIAWVVLITSAIAIFYLSKLFKFSKEVTGSLMLVGVLGNTTYLGIPIIEAYFGTDALGYVLMYDQLGTFIALSTYGTFISVYYSSTSKVDKGALFIKMLSFPPFIALLLAFLLMGISFHPVISSVLSSLASTIVPLALVAVGLQLKFKLPSHELKPFGVALGVKLLFAPLVAILICAIFGWDSMAAKVSIMESSMAPMITAAAIASMAGLAPRLSSAIVGYGILISFVSTWIVYNIII